MIAADGVNNVNGHANGNGRGAGALLATATVALPSPEEIRELNVHQRIRWIIAEARSLPNGIQMENSNMRGMIKSLTCCARCLRNMGSTSTKSL